MEHFWADVHFISGEPNPYLEVIERLDLIENYNINVRTENMELYSHISLPKTGMDKDNPYYYHMFHFVGQKEGSILVDGISVEIAKITSAGIIYFLQHELSDRAIINFVSKKRPLLSVDRKSCVSMPSVKDELEQLETKFIEQLINIVCEHVKNEEIDVNDSLFSTILNIVVTSFPSLADIILFKLCETPLRDAPIPGYLNLDTKATINGLISSANFTLKNVDFREYEEVYRRLLLGKLLDVKTIEVIDDCLTVQGAAYQELPITPIKSCRSKSIEVMRKKHRFPQLQSKQINGKVVSKNTI